MRTYADYSGEEKQAYKDSLKEEGELFFKRYYKQAALDSVKYVRSVLGDLLPDSYWNKRVMEINND